MFFDDALGQVVLFGGSTGVSTLADTWMWNGTNWTKASPAASPPARAGASMAYDPASSAMVLFGGYRADLPGPVLNDTWTWDGATWTQASPGTRPPARADGSMAYDPTSRQMVLFGGEGGGGRQLDDTWTWGGNWVDESPATSPTARAGASMAFDPSLRALILYGGSGGGTALHDTWEWNVTVWEERQTTTFPSARSLASMAYDLNSNHLVLFGGQSSTGAALDGTWKY